MSPKRPPTAADERDLYPRKTPPKGHPADFSAIPHEVEERGTGVVEGDDLRAVRSRRSTGERFEKLEDFKDDMLERFPRVEANVEFLVEAEKERRTAREKSRDWWRALGLKVAGGLFSGTVIVAVLRAVGVL